MINVSKAGSQVAKADAAKDIDLINQYALKELAPEDVFCFSVVLCNNDIDRDYERFTAETLEEMCGLFVGKTGISDHRWSAGEQIARLYRCETKQTEEKTADGQPLIQLIGSAYMVRNEQNQPIIDAIEAGITKEVSVGLAIKECTCSLCGKNFDWFGECAEHHVKGETYEDGFCFGELSTPVDAYEFSFVAVPAQPGAGVTKDFSKNALKSMTKEDLNELKARIDEAMMGHEEREKRASLIEENKEILKG